jgi:8-oxo-dGTP diphosphatase
VDRTATDHWYSRLPTVYCSVGALITNELGDPLLVMPTYRSEWTVPGGVAEEGEPPHLACQREVAEEVGVDVVPDALLAVHFIAPSGPQVRPILYFMFDCGTVTHDDIALQRSELRAFQFCHPYENSTAWVNLYVSDCVVAGLAARTSGRTAYLPGRVAARRPTWR